MNKAYSIFFSVFPGLGLGLANFAQAQDVALFDKFDDWEISETYTDAGLFEVCAATKTFENGEAVIFYADGTSLLVGLLLERWALDSNDTYDIALQFGDTTRQPGQAYSGEDNKSALVNLDFLGSLQEINTAENLYLHTAAGSLRFNIAGFPSALEKVLECANENQATSSE